MMVVVVVVSFHMFGLDFCGFLSTGGDFWVFLSYLIMGWFCIPHASAGVLGHWLQEAGGYIIT